MRRAVVVLPTYNERENIVPLLRAVWILGSIGGSASASGISHGSLELARKRSDSRITGVR